MSWSYDATNLSTSDASGRINVVRLLTGDTDTDDQQVQNEEIQFALSENGNNIYFAAAWVARVIAGKYSRLVTLNLDDQIQAEYSDLAKQYKTLADQMDYQGKKTSGGIGMVAGGINKSTMEAVRQDTTRVAPSFRRGQFNNPPDEDSAYFYDID